MKHYCLVKEEKGKVLCICPSKFDGHCLVNYHRFCITSSSLSLLIRSLLVFSRSEREA